MKGHSSEFKVLDSKRDQDYLVLSVEVDQEVVQRAYRKVYKNLLRHVHVPGFRPGKVPLPVLSNAVGKENFAKEVRKELLPQFYYDALASTEYQAIEGVEYLDEKMGNGEPFLFTAKVLVAPEVKMGDFRKLDFKPPTMEPVTDTDIEKTLKKLQQDHARTKKAEDETVTDGDYALVSFSGSVDGKDYKSLTRENLGLTVGADSFLPEFDQNLVGKKRGEEFAFGLTVSKKAIANEYLVGRKVMFRGRVKSVFRQELPAIDDEFAKDLGNFKNLGELKDKIKRDMEKHRESAFKGSRDEALRKALAEIVQVQIPGQLLEKRLEDRLEEFKRGMKERGLTFEEYLTEYGKDEKTVREELNTQVVEEIKVEFALDHIAKDESQVVTDEDFHKRLHTMAHMLGKEEAEILEALDERGQRILQKQDMLREKAFESLKEHYK